MKTPVDTEPEVDLLPAHEFEALHEDALVELHEIVLLPPTTKLVDEAFKETVGLGGIACEGVGVEVFVIVVVGAVEVVFEDDGGTVVEVVVVDLDEGEVSGEEDVDDVVLEVGVAEVVDVEEEVELDEEVEVWFVGEFEIVDRLATLAEGLQRDNEPTI